MKTTIYLLLLLMSVQIISCTGKKQANNSNKNAELTFDSIVVEKKISLFPDKPDSKPFATININFTYPNSFRSEEELSKLQDIFIKMLFGDKFPNIAPQAAVEKYINLYEDSYRQDVTKIFNEEASLSDDYDWFLNSLSYGSEVKNNIVLVKENLVSFRIFSWDYTGGAHGDYAYTNHSIDLQNISSISLSDIMVGDYKNSLTEIIKNRLPQVLIDKSEDVQINKEEIKAYFFDFDNIEVNDNFMITENGITFTYNPYEIAPFAAGVLDVQIPFEEISNLLNTEAITKYFPDKDLLKSK